MGEHAAYTLSWFDWATIAAVGAVLLAIISFLIGIIVKILLSKLATETKERQDGDSELAKLVKSATEKLQEFSDSSMRELRAMSESNIREHGTFANVARIGESHSKIYKGIEEVHRMVTRIEAEMVTKEQCMSRCAAGQ